MEHDADAAAGEDARTRVFLSYSRKDSGLVGRIAEALMAAGFLADFDQASHDPHNVSAGISAEDEWWKRLQEMIAAADVMVFLVSPDSAESKVCDEEIAYARALGKRIIAVLARPVDFAKAPPRLAALNVRIDFSEGGPGFEAAFSALTSALEMNVIWHREGRKYLARVQEWDSEGRPRSQLLREGAVEEAERWALARPRNEPEPGELFLAWIAASRAQIKRDAAVRAFWRRVTAVFVLTTLVATVAGAWFVVNGQRNLGRSESLMLARTSDQLYNKGDYVRALQVAILASRGSFLRPSTDEAKAAFAKTAQALAHVASIRQGFPEGSELDPVIARAYPALGGTRLVTANEISSVFVWDTQTGEQLGESFTINAELGDIQELLVPEGEYLVAWNGGGAHVISLQDGSRLPAKLGVEAEDEGVQLMHAAMSADGKRLAAGLTDGTVRTYDLASGRRLAEFPGRAEPSVEVALSADGTKVLVVRLGEAFIADAAGGEIISGPFGPEVGQYWGGFLSPDGTRVVLRHNTGEYDWELGRQAEDLSVPLQTETESIEIWNAATGERMARAAFPDIVQRAVFIDRLRRIATVSPIGNVQLWDADTGAAIGDIILTDEREEDVDIAADADTFGTFSYLTGLQIWDIRTGAPLLEAGALEAGTDRWNGISHIPGTEEYLAWNGRRAVRLTIVDGQVSATPVTKDKAGFVSHAALSPDGRIAITQDEDNEVFFWDTSFNGTEILGPLKHDNSLVPPQFIGDGSRVLTIEGNEARIWNTGPARTIPYKGKTDIGASAGAMLSPDGARQLMWNASGRAVLRDTTTGEQIGGELLLGPPEDFKAVFDAHSPQLAISFEGIVQLLDTNTGENGDALLEHPVAILEMQFALGGRRLVTLQYDSTLTIWNTETMEPVTAPVTVEDVVLRVLPVSGRMVVVTNGNGQLFDLETGAAIGAPMVVWTDADLKAETEYLPVSKVAYSSDESVIAMWSQKRIGFWSASDAAPVQPVVTPAAPIVGAALAPNGRQAALLLDYPMRGAVMMDLETGDVAQAPLAHPTSPVSAAFAPDGETLVTIANDSYMRFWNLESGFPISAPVFLASSQAEIWFSTDSRRMLVLAQGGVAEQFDVTTKAELVSWSGDFAYQDAAWQQDAGRLVISELDGRLLELDIGWSAKRDAAPDDIAQVCAAKLVGTPDEGGVPFVRRLDDAAVFAAPILRGREGEDVCTAPVVPWWETAAGAVFGWAFR